MCIAFLLQGEAPREMLCGVGVSIPRQTRGAQSHSRAGESVIWKRAGVFRQTQARSTMTGTGQWGSRSLGRVRREQRGVRGPTGASEGCPCCPPARGPTGGGAAPGEVLPVHESQLSHVNLLAFIFNYQCLRTYYTLARCKR